MLSSAITLFISLALRALAVLLILVAWLAYLDFWTRIDGFSLAFIKDSLLWASGITVAGLFVLALSFVLERRGR